MFHLWNIGHIQYNCPNFNITIYKQSWDMSLKYRNLINSYTVTI